MTSAHVRRLKLRELLLPKVVDRGQLRETRARPSAGPSNGASNGATSIWSVPADLFPRDLSQSTKRLIDEVRPATVLLACRLCHLLHQQRLGG